MGPNADNIHSHIGLYCDSNPLHGIVTVLNATIAAANASGNNASAIDALEMLLWKLQLTHFNVSDSIFTCHCCVMRWQITPSK